MEENKEIIQKITDKKEFSQLREIDAEKAFGHFERRQASDDEKIRLTRDLLRKIFSAFTSQKILSLKEKEPEWILRKHLSTRERMPFYREVYKRIFKDMKESTVIDLGAGVNGFSYGFIEKKLRVNYVAVEGVGQLVNLMNFYFERNKINGRAYHLSLFELEELKKIIKKTPRPRMFFLFKTLDSLEMMERNYSKKLLSEIVPLADKIVVSFATRSMIKRTRFRVQRNWIVNFISENFRVIDDFELGSERYIIFGNGN